MKKPKTLWQVFEEEETKYHRSRETTYHHMNSTDTLNGSQQLLADITRKSLDYYERVLSSEKTKEKRFALRKLVEIAQACPFTDLTSRAQKLLAQ